jgi:hypothetical protein
MIGAIKTNAKQLHPSNWRVTCARGGPGAFPVIFAGSWNLALRQRGTLHARLEWAGAGLGFVVVR